MRRIILTTLILSLTLTLSPVAMAQVADEQSDNMELLANWDDGGKYREGTDLAFWNNTAVLGKYGGMRLLDIEDPSNPKLLGSLDCNGSQNDVSVWKHLAFISVDSPMSTPACDSPSASAVQYGTGSAWEGIRIVDIRNPSEPTQINTVYTDCGSHTHTLVPDVNYPTPSRARRRRGCCCTPRRIRWAARACSATL